MIFILRNIAVVFGGVSNENEISVITGTMAANVLAGGGDCVFPLYIAQDGATYTGENLMNVRTFKNGGYSTCKKAIVARGGFYVLNSRGLPKKFQPIDVAVNCCHGGSGEGGGICGLFECNNIPLVGAGIFESSAFIDKYYTKLILSALGVNSAPWVYLRSREESAKCGELGFPLIVKPATLGSSIGVEKVESEEELAAALDTAFTYDGGVLVEQYLPDKRDINCAAFYSGGEVITSECEEVFSGGELLSFEDKYGGGGRAVFPAELPEQTSDLIKQITKNVYSELNMRGIVRFDFIISRDTLYLSEVNTVPGSLSYYLLSSGFKNFYPVLKSVTEQAISDYGARRAKKLIHTGILNNIPEGSRKMGIK